MASLKNIKQKVISFKKTGKVTHAMEAVSAVKMRKTQERALGTRTYAATALSLLERLTQSQDVSKHPLLVSNGATKTCIILITSDKGLAGALNSAVIKSAERYIIAHTLTPSTVSFIAIGRRGAEYFTNRGYTVTSRYDNMGDDVSESSIQEITQHILSARANKDINSCVLIYTNFVSTFEQEAVVREIVPITQGAIKVMVDGIRPAKGKYTPAVPTKDVTQPAYTIEPSTDTVLATLLPRLIAIALFHGVLESKASEHSARMVAMKSATDKARDMTKALTRVFNKVRQATITREVSEITSGMEAMK